MSVLQPIWSRVSLINLKEEHPSMRKQSNQSKVNKSKWGDWIDHSSLVLLLISLLVSWSRAEIHYVHPLFATRRCAQDTLTIFHSPNMLLSTRYSHLTV